MTVRIDTTAENDGLRLRTQGTHPSAPSAGHVIFYHVTGTANPGLFFEDSEGQKFGPFITGSSSGNILDQSDPYGMFHRLSGSSSDDDEFSSNTIANYTEVDPTGSTTWSIGRHLLSCIFSGQLSGDLSALLKAMTLADGEWFEVRLKALARNVNYTMVGIVITDGTSSTSNSMSGHITKVGANVYMERYTGTLTNAAGVSSQSVDVLGEEAFAGSRLRLRRVSSTDFRVEISGDEGVQWTALGITGANPGFTPTHAGFIVSVWGAAHTSIVAFDFIRHMS